MPEPTPPPEGIVTLAREGAGRDEVALRMRYRNGEPIYELIVNGAFAMDSAETSSEHALASCAAGHRGRVLVGGLGLGYTTERLVLDGARHVDVIELSAPLLRWARQGLTPTLAAVAASPAVHLHHGDVAGALASGRLPGAPERQTWDAVLLDVDNGPDFLLHEENAPLYQPPLLSAALGCLKDGGLLAIWCQQANPQLASTLHRLARRVDGVDIHVIRDGRPFTYVIYVARDPVPPGQARADDAAR